MSYISSFEAKEIASYLQSSLNLVPVLSGPPKRGQWLDAISKSCGFRDWNAMKARVPDVPETEWGNWYGSFFSIACVLDEDQNFTIHLDWFRNRESSRHDSATNLAKLVTKNCGIKSRGIKFSYSQPDTDENTESHPLLFPIDQTMHSSNIEKLMKAPIKAPIIATSEDKKTKIFLWWLSHTYTMAEYYPERIRRFSSQSFGFNDEGSPRTGWASSPFNPMSLASTFLINLTGITPPIRKCFYITELPNGPDESFIPVFVEEGSEDGPLTEFNLGTDRDIALELIQKQNMEQGISVNDSNSISRKFQEVEPHEEMYFDDFSGFEGD